MNTLLLLVSLLGAGSNFSEFRLLDNGSFSALLSAGVCLQFHNGAWTQVCSPANGQLLIQNAAASSGAIIDVTSDGIFQIYDRAATDNATLQVNNVFASVGFSWGGAQLKFGGGACSSVIQTLTFPANPGAASETTSGLLNAGQTLLGIDTWVHVAGTNCTSVSIGDGTIADLWGHNVAITHGSQTTSANATSHWGNPLLSAADVTITANGGNCFGLTVYVQASYCQDLAPAQD